MMNGHEWLTVKVSQNMAEELCHVTRTFVMQLEEICCKN